MCLSFLIPLLSGIFGASTTTAIVGTVSSAVTAVATASAGEVLAVASTTVAAAGIVGAAEGMSKKAKENRIEERRIYKECEEEKALAEQKFTERKNKINKAKKDAQLDVEKASKAILGDIKKNVSFRKDFRRRLAKLRKG